MSSPSQIGVGRNHTLIDAGSKAKAGALQEEDNSVARGHARMRCFEADEWPWGKSANASHGRAAAGSFPTAR